VLADPERAAHVKAFARSTFGNSATIRDQVMKYAGHLLTTAPLLPYDGDLTGVLDSELNDAFGAFLDNWAPT
jgi:hypothetical protein